MKKSVVILLCILNIFLFNSCKDKNKSTFSPQLEYISISCNHSNYDYCYSFTAYTKDSKETVRLTFQQIVPLRILNLAVSI